MKYKVVDVFTNISFKGNPVAVLLDDSASLNGEQMLAIARWTNLSETTFVIPTQSNADYKLRIFTTEGELPFAGHPTLGTSHAVREWGLVDRAKSRWIQECAWGDIEIVSEQVGSEEILTFGIDGITASPVSQHEVAECLHGLAVQGQPMLVDAGPHWTVISVKNTEQALLNYQPDREELRKFCEKYKSEGFCVFAKVDGSTDDIQLRTFTPSSNPFEDPVCGSGNAAVAYYRNLSKRYSAFQGAALQRDGRIRLDYHSNKIWVGGSCKTVVDGEIST